MKKNKQYDVLAEVRRIKEELSVKYWNNTDQLLKDLKAVRKRYSQRLKAAK